MRFFASWWERIPVREAAPALLAVLAIVGAFDDGGEFFKFFFGPTGFLWG